ncbi:MAG TPA: pseudouridine-5'-phosphate glycosidase, partial [Candidatus Cloacimonadota bacterium]|nr:pseudouridine-5'-phosphate glycosidase [Candidatus Cloacimonadota bacterium]
AEGVVPATIAIVKGEVHIGLDDLSFLENPESRLQLRKISLREIPFAMAQGWSGGTTVSATMWLALQAGIKVFATGGIGGVHRNWQSSLDVSTDLIALARIPVAVVCAGCKAILDIPATLEVLETYAVPVIGWQTDDFPAFYSRSSGEKVLRTDSIGELAEILKYTLEIGETGLLIVNPIPEESEIKHETIEPVIANAIQEAESRGIKGKETTPYLLSTLAKMTQGASIVANLALLKNNVRLGAMIAREIK